MIFIQFLFWSFLEAISKYWCYYFVHFLIVLQKLLGSFPMFLWSISQQIQPFNAFELAKKFIDSLLNILYLIGWPNYISILSVVQW